MSLELVQLKKKPRTSCLTMVLEKGLDPISFHNILKYSSDKVDFVKFTSGIALVDNGLQEKIAMCKQYDIDIFFGGTLFEKYHQQGLLNEYIELLHKHEITSVEISNGTLDISLQERLKLLHNFKNLSFKTFVEIGSKDHEDIVPPSVWIDEMTQFLDAGVDYLITESRESARAGLFRSSGEIREGLLKDILLHVDIDKVIFEAPNKDSQCFLINALGGNVNLGNISIQDVNMLQVQRLGLRYDTFFVDK